MARVTQGPSTLSTTNSASWIGDYLDREHVVPGGAQLDPAQFLADDAVTVTTTAAAVAAATTLAVSALSGPIPTGTMLRFASGVYARLTVAAVAGATALTVEPLPAAVASGAVATYAGSGKKLVVAGTAIGRTLVERDAGTGYGPAAAADDEIFLTVHDVTDADLNPDVDLYRPGSLVKENFLPGFAALAAGVQSALRSRYQCTRGAL